tara:strand:- start:69 stop:710 length:642 start_codon:yes stop_codon:yes gene_type:complete
MLFYFINFNVICNNIKENKMRKLFCLGITVLIVACSSNDISNDISDDNVGVSNLTMRCIILAFLLLGISGYSQTISKQVIGPAGATFENGNNKLSYTAGEVAVGAMTDEDGTYQLGNGYYPSLNISTLTTESSELQLQMKVFPNPVTEAIFITHPTEQYFEVNITDVNGKQILQTTHQKQTPLSVQTLTSGTYFVTITTKSLKQTNTYKIIKK